MYGDSIGAFKVAIRRPAAAATAATFATGGPVTDRPEPRVQFSSGAERALIGRDCKTDLKPGVGDEDLRHPLAINQESRNMSGKEHKGVSHFEPSSQTQKNTDRSSLRTALNKTGAGDLATPGNGSRLPLHETAVALSTHPARITVRRRRMSDIAVMIFAAGAMATAFPSHCVAASADGGGAGATSAAGDGGAGGGGNE
ncbi:hypothetical protein FSO04_41915, partial [Paraburkholderia madseniana]